MRALQRNRSFVASSHVICGKATERHEPEFTPIIDLNGLCLDLNGLCLGPASLPPRTTPPPGSTVYLPRVSPKRSGRVSQSVSGAYRLTVCVCRASRSAPNCRRPARTCKRQAGWNFRLPCKRSIRLPYSLPFMDICLYRWTVVAGRLKCGWRCASSWRRPPHPPAAAGPQTRSAAPS
jgi:hypothetical protein